MLRSYQDLAQELSRLAPLAGSAIVVGIDGCGGAGKSTFADRLCRAWAGSQVVHTDDFASWDCPLDWWPRLLEQVLIPLSENRPARYQRYDWDKKELAEWHTVETSRVILEGVSATRAEFSSFLAFRIWVDCPADMRLARGLERDGPSMEAQWKSWMEDEDRYILRDDPIAQANLVVLGNPKVDHAPDELQVRS